MDRGRKVLAALCTVVIVGAAAASWFLLQPTSQDLALKRLFIDVGLWVTVLAVVFGVKGQNASHVGQIIDVLRALSRGRHDVRVDHDDFSGELKEIARAANEAAAAMGEFDDPNLGPVSTRPRQDQLPPKERVSTPPEARPSKPPAPAQDDKSTPEPPTKNVRVPSSSRMVIDENIDSDHPDIGEVRVMNKSAIERAKEAVAQEQAAKKQRLASMLDGDDSDGDDSDGDSVDNDDVVPADEGVSDDAQAAKDTSDDSADNVDAPRDDDDDDDAATIIEPARQASLEGRAEEVDGDEDGNEVEASTDGADDTDDVDDTPALPSRQELKTLFDTFLVKKQDNDENTDDLDFELFAETLLSESERLITDHQCRGVRFEITVDAGEVSLQPRLMR